MAIETLKYLGADGVTVTANLSGYDSVLATGGSMMFENSYTFRGATSSILATGTTTSGAVYGTKNITSTNTLSFDIPVRPDALPSGELYFLQLGAGTTRNIALATTNTGLLRVRDAANANAWSSSAGALVVGSPCIISVYATRDSAEGTFRVVVYEVDGTTIRADSGLLVGKNTGASDFTTFRASGAKSATGTLASQWLWGEPRWDTTAQGLIPAWTPPASVSACHRWDETTLQYVPLDIYRWNGSSYVAIETS